MYIYRQPPPGQLQFYGVTQLVTDGAHWLESADIGRVVPELIPESVVAFSCFTVDQCLCASLFPHYLQYNKEVVGMEDTESVGGGNKRLKDN